MYFCCSDVAGVPLNMLVISLDVIPALNKPKLIDCVIAPFLYSVRSKSSGLPNVEIYFKSIALPTAIKSCPQ